MQRYSQSSLINNGKLCDNFVPRFLKDPTQLLDHPATLSGDGLLLYSLNNQHVCSPAMRECGCGNMSRFKNNRREKVEESIASYANTTFKRNEELRIASLGSGGFFQDFVILCKMVALGYKNIRLSLIDTDYSHALGNVSNSNFANLKLFSTYFFIAISNDGKVQLSNSVFDDLSNFINKNMLDIETNVLENNIVKGFTALSQFIGMVRQVASQNKVDIQVNLYPSLKDALKNDAPYHCVTAIDFDVALRCLTEFSLLHQALAENGRYYLSYKEYDFIFSKEKCIYLSTDPSVFEKALRENPILNDFNNKFKNINTNTIHFTQLDTSGNTNAFNWLYLFPILSSSQCKRIEVNCFHVDKDSEILEKDKQVLEYFLQLLTPKNKTVTVSIINDYEHLKKLYQTGNKLSQPDHCFISTLLGVYIRAPEDVAEMLNLVSKGIITKDFFHGMCDFSLNRHKLISFISSEKIPGNIYLDVGLQDPYDFGCAMCIQDDIKHLFTVKGEPTAAILKLLNLPLLSEDVDLSNALDFAKGETDNLVSINSDNANITNDDINDITEKDDSTFRSSLFHRVQQNPSNQNKIEKEEKEKKTEKEEDKINKSKEEAFKNLLSDKLSNKKPK